MACLLRRLFEVHGEQKGGGSCVWYIDLYGAQYIWRNGHLPLSFQLLKVIVRLGGWFVVVSRAPQMNRKIAHIFNGHLK